ncbi:hypothetical protein [Cetobacterium sp.]|uniref:hypothetical protein n=1 Tax=Cetobacterium sp. TaxID=2071632 RepID=UPI0025C6B23B|nr:hypothetical protein [Cetobacterium sp.]
MKKRILLAMAILSTSLLAASGNITVSGKPNTSITGTTATTDISLTGRAVKAVTVGSDIPSVDFGTVMLGKTATTSVGLIVGGEKDFKVQLSTNEIANVVVTGLENAVTLVSSDTTQEVPMTLAYTPTATGEELTTTLTVTASYTD